MPLPTSARPLDPPKPVSQRMSAVASGPSPRGGRVADDQRVEALGGDQLGKRVAVRGAHASFSFSIARASR